MGYIENSLVPGETVLYKTHLHWIILIGKLFAALLLGAAGVACIVGSQQLNLKGDEQNALLIAGALLLVIAGITLAAGVIRKNSTEVAVTNKRVLIKTGIMARKSIEVLLAKVESIGVNESAFGRMLGYGSVIIRGTGGTFETFHNIANPNEFRKQVQQQIGGGEAR